MFGTMGISELVIILVIVLIIFGAGRLPQIGEGVGKALRGFKKEISEIPPPVEEQNPVAPSETPMQTQPAAAPSAQEPSASQPVAQPATQQPYKAGPERTPGTLAAMVYSGIGPEPVQPVSEQPEVAPASTYVEQHAPVSMEQRASGTVPRQTAQYPPMPTSVTPTPTGKRPSAVVNKEAVARVQAQQSAIKAKTAQTKPNIGSPEDLQSLGEGLGGALRTFREATTDVRNSIDPEMRTIQAELEAAKKEVEETIEVAKQPILPKDPPSST
ncbi:MAG: twin-arginine translocase TatA/TatE family subunit [Nitrospirae bacterium]|nr:twin-arginine translocase TatA/TatE family subunit [Nitrospirota bacterium]